MAAGHAIHVVSGLSPVHSLVLLAALASAGAAGLTCVAGTALGGRGIGIAAGSLFVDYAHNQATLDDGMQGEIDQTASMWTVGLNLSL